MASVPSRARVRLGSRSLRERGSVWGVTVLALAVALVACSHNSETSSGSNTSGEADGLVAALLETTTPYQAEIIHDGIVEFAEYEGAMLATAECLKDAGFDATVTRSDDQGLYYQVVVHQRPNLRASSAEEALAPLDRAYEQCELAYSRDVQRVYSALVGPPPGLDALRHATLDCLEAAGMEPGSDVDDETLSRLVQEAMDIPGFRDCLHSLRDR